MGLTVTFLCKRMDFVMLTPSHLSLLPSPLSFFCNHLLLSMFSFVLKFLLAHMGLSCVFLQQDVGLCHPLVSPRGNTQNLRLVWTTLHTAASGPPCTQWPTLHTVTSGYGALLLTAGSKQSSKNLCRREQSARLGDWVGLARIAICFHGNIF